MTEKKTIILDNKDVDLATIYKIGRQQINVRLSDDEKYKKSINRGADFLQSLLKEQGHIYGVTTGYGDSCDVSIDSALINELPKHLYTFHGCGTGDFLTPEQGRMVLAVRLVSLAKGMSGVRYRLLQQLTRLLHYDVIPVIPCEGSVGASGDLTPLSYVAAVLCGQRQVYFQGEKRPTTEVFAKIGIEALTLQPKEGLAIMNGTAVMTALAIEAYHRAHYLAKLAGHITALSSIALGTNPDHFSEILFSVKPHSGQQQIAKQIAQTIKKNPFFSGRLQERYSVRCAPHVIGVLSDALPFMQTTLKNELNSANDNPIVDADNQRILHGGHFYGGHVAFVMDSLKNAVANIADLLDRQLALMVDSKFNQGLPRNLSGEVTHITANHGLKAVQIAASAWTAEALKLTLPASIFSRSTESHNQDKVSMGTIAARDALRVLQLSEQVTAVTLMAAVQAIQLRQRQGQLTVNALSQPVQRSIKAVTVVFPLLCTDRELDNTIVTITKMIQQQAFAY
ncbi:MAG: histidine ammonia-lyase [Gammaproteobacteria bacterium]|nr:MAG: histidine ammonia-lyase [Gammaproteobacteria bacterium]